MTSKEELLESIENILKEDYNITLIESYGARRYDGKKCDIPSHLLPFFYDVNEGHYTLTYLTIPNECIIESYDMDKIVELIFNTGVNNEKN